MIWSDLTSQYQTLPYTLPELRLGPVQKRFEFLENVSEEENMPCLASINMIFYSEPWFPVLSEGHDWERSEILYI